MPKSYNRGIYDNEALGILIVVFKPPLVKSIIPQQEGAREKGTPKCLAQGIQDALNALIIT